MSEKRFDQARPFATLAIAGLVWLALPVALKTIARASFFELTAPITATASHVRDLQAFWSLRAHTNRELIEAGRDLARVNASYELTTEQNADLQTEIAQLEAEMRVPALPGFRLEPARVALRNFSGWWQTLVIRKGRDYRITVDAPVVFTGGVVGRVSQVGAYTSVVELISNPGVRLAAVIEGDTRPISYRGGVNPTFGPAEGVIEFVPLDIFARPSAPRRLVTSGLGGDFPGRPDHRGGGRRRPQHGRPVQDRQGDARSPPLRTLRGHRDGARGGKAAMRRILAVLPTLLLLWALVAELNHELAPVHVYLFVGGLFVTYTSLTFPLGAGMAASFLAGLVLDANTPVPFGTHGLLFAAAHALLYDLRDRMPRDDTLGRVAIALLANFGLFLALSFLQVSRSPEAAGAWPRLFADLLCSQVVLAIAGPWFFSLQRHTLVLAGAEPETLD